MQSTPGLIVTWLASEHTSRLASQSVLAPADNVNELDAPQQKYVLHEDVSGLASGLEGELRGSDEQM